MTVDAARAGLLRKMSSEGRRRDLPDYVSADQVRAELARRGVSLEQAAAWCRRLDVCGKPFERQLRLF